MTVGTLLPIPPSISLILAYTHSLTFPLFLCLLLLSKSFSPILTPLGSLLFAPFCSFQLPNIVGTSLFILPFRSPACSSKYHPPESVDGSCCQLKKTALTLSATFTCVWRSINSSLWKLLKVLLKLPVMLTYLALCKSQLCVYVCVRKSPSEEFAFSQLANVFCFSISKSIVFRDFYQSCRKKGPEPFSSDLDYFFLTLGFVSSPSSLSINL